MKRTKLHEWFNRNPGRPGASGSRAVWTLGVTTGDSGTRPVTLADAEYRRGLYVLGGAGGGKSRLLQLLVRQHIRRDAGFCLLDPHGDLTDAVLLDLFEEQRRRQRERKRFDPSRIYLFEPFREDAVLGMNVLDAGSAPLYPHVSSVVGTLRRFFASAWGPKVDGLVRASLLTLAGTGQTLAEVPQLLSSPEALAVYVSRVRDPALRSYWTDRFGTLPASARSALVESVLSKIDGCLLADPRLRATLGQCQGAPDFRQLMDEGAWVLFNLSKGQLRDSSQVLGSLAVAQIQTAALSRADTPESCRRPFGLIVDEFQSFRSDGFETILSEARKYGLYLTLAHQYLGQLEGELRDAIFGNVPNLAVFAVAPGDAAAVAKTFADASVTAEELVQLPTGCSVIRRRGEAPATTRILPVLPPPHDPVALSDFTQRVRSRHSRPLAEVMGELEGRAFEMRQGSIRPVSQPDDEFRSNTGGGALVREADDE